MRSDDKRMNPPKRYAHRGTRVHEAEKAELEEDALDQEIEEFYEDASPLPNIWDN